MGRKLKHFQVYKLWAPVTRGNERGVCALNSFHPWLRLREENLGGKDGALEA